MKKLFSFVFSIVFLFQSTVLATPLPYDVLGEFSGDTSIRPAYRGKLGPLEAMVVEDTILKNERFLSGVEDESHEHPEFLKKIKKFQSHNYRGKTAPDTPISYVYYLLQRLYPSPDGIDLVPNARSNDPVADFTPQIIGTILNSIRHFITSVASEANKDEETDPAEGPVRSCENIINELASTVSLMLKPWTNKEKKKLPACMKRNNMENELQAVSVFRSKDNMYLIVRDFASALVKGLTEQQHSPDLLFPHFLENVLFGFAMRKAAESENPREAMHAFYAAMPDVIEDGWMPDAPFTQDAYDAAVAKMETVKWRIHSKIAESVGIVVPLPPEEATAAGDIAESVGTPLPSDPEEAATASEIAGSVGTSLPSIPEEAAAAGEIAGSVGTPLPFNPEEVAAAGDLIMSPREYLAYFAGLWQFRKLYPRLHVYTNTTYNKESFPNCGATSLWNFMNLLLWDFKERRFRHELLLDDSGHPLCTPKLLKFYGGHISEGKEEEDCQYEYDTPEKQNTRDAIKAWTEVVSGLVDEEGKPLGDIVYKRGNCEITEGIGSMAGVIAALFPSVGAAVEGIDDLFERTATTFDALLALFAPHGEHWSWTVQGAEPGQEHSITKEHGFVIDFRKTGANLPQSSDSDGSESGDESEGNDGGKGKQEEGLDKEDQEEEKPMISWTFSNGHYSLSTPSGNPELWIHGYDILKRQADREAYSFAPVDFLFLANFSIIEDIVPLWQCMVHEFLSSRFREMDNFMGVLFRSSTEHQKSLLTTHFLPSLDMRNPEDVLHSLQTLKSLDQKTVPPHQLQKMGRLLANALAALPKRDTHATACFLELGIGEGGEVRDDPIELHPRINSQIGTMIRLLKEDPSFAYECLAANNSEIDALFFIMRCVPEGSLSKEQVLKAMMEFSDEDDITPEFWEELFARFGNVFHDNEGIIDPATFLRHKTSERSPEFVFNLLTESSPETIAWFMEQGWITTEIIDSISERLITKWLEEDADEWELEFIAKVAPLLGITYKKIVAVKKSAFLSGLIEENYNNAKKKVELLQSLGTTKDDVFPTSKPTKLAYILAELLATPKRELILALFEAFHISLDDLESLNNYNYQCDAKKKKVSFSDGNGNSNFSEFEYFYPAADYFEGTCLEFLQKICPELWEVEGAHEGPFSDCTGGKGETIDEDVVKEQ